MRLKLYRARAMTEALAQMRRELGPDALIVGSRRIAGGVEITAAIEHPSAMAVPPVSSGCYEAAPSCAVGSIHDTTGLAGQGKPDRALIPDRGLTAGSNGRIGRPPAQGNPRGSVQPEPARLAILAYHAVPPGLAVRLQAGPLAVALAGALRFTALALSPGCRPLLLAGPPGAGKTLSIVRLATRMVLKGSLPLVITTDGKRAGAIEQLKAFTRLLGIELQAAETPAMLARALLHRAASTPVLIDTGGCDPFDRGERELLLSLTASAVATVAAVLPAGSDAAESAELAAALAGVGATMLIATRLDAARRLGGILAAAEAGLALAEAGIGPGAADGLVPLTPDLLAARLQRVTASAAQTDLSQ